MCILSAFSGVTTAQCIAVGAAAVLLAVLATLAYTRWRSRRGADEPAPASPPVPFGSPPQPSASPIFTRSSKYPAALLVTSIMFPGAAGVTTMMLALLKRDIWINQSPRRAFIFGTLIAFGAWILAAPFFRRFGDARTADTGTYSQLASRALALRGRLSSAGVAYDPDAEHPLAAAESALGLWGYPPSTGVPWATGAGYDAVRRLIHAAEEAQLPTEGADAIYVGLVDRAALNDSHVPGWLDQVRWLDEAIRGLGGPEILEGLPGEPASPPSRPVMAAEQAAAILRWTRSSLNSFRDSRREELTTVRNQLFGTVLFTGLMAYLLLGIALFAGAKPPNIIAGVVFYTIGALVGLFKRLHSRFATPTIAVSETIDFTTVRLIATPLFSGLAAIGGVVVTSLLLSLNTTKGQAAPQLKEVFDLGLNPGGILAAAVFGLTPALLVNALERKADKWKTELASATPTESQAAPPVAATR